MTDKIKSLIANLKHAPGVYLMYDKDDKVIYVGKAKDLSKRVSQYFLRPQSGKVFKMVTNVDHFETIITNNEKEAFILEMNLIQKYYPRYNILLKDGSHYPYLALKKSGDPTLLIKRHKKEKGYDYFGPFPNSGAAHQMVDLINRIFPLRKCVHLPGASCLYYHLGQCLGPCINKIDEATNNQLREQVKSFLNGNNQKIKKETETKMLEASKQEQYELANEYKKIVTAIEHINTTQIVEMNDRKDRDIFAYSIRDGYLALAILLYRHGVLLGKEVYVVEQFLDEQEQVANLIDQFYTRTELPDEVVINSPLVIELLNDHLDVNFISVTKGKLNDLVLSGKENANNALDEYFLSSRLDDNKLMMLETIGQTLNIKAPFHIELFDNSHLQGSSPIGAMVAFINGERCPKLYRKFKIEHQEARDDLKSMQEIIYRHYARCIKENKKLPDLILVDGGLTQIKAGQEALEKAKANIPLFGLYKNDKHQTEGLMDINGQTYHFDNKAIFFLLTRMQDEVHRFAISYHREKRKKAMTVSFFEDIKGLGIKRQEMLTRIYPDKESLTDASLDELTQVLPSDVAEALFTKLHQ